ncbi:MAG: hypothetical protein GX240_01840 [Candidatus Atribacteria bacterium]|nr:hypothetical protein [Candidatus Atribacteria bacterium]
MKINLHCITGKAAKFLDEASVSLFDSSELMPPAAGSCSFWAGIPDYVSGRELMTVRLLGSG